MRKHIKEITIFFMVTILIGVLFSSLIGGKTISIESAHGEADLTHLDLQKNIVSISTNGMDYYPNQLLTPDTSWEKLSAQTFVREDLFRIPYGTYRLRMHLSKDTTYAIQAMAINFAQRMWINGEEQEMIGHPADHKEAVEPSARTYLYVFTPQSDETEIVIQYANFVYRGGGEAYPLYVSQYQNIIYMEQIQLFRACIITGCLITIFIFYLGMYLFFQRRFYFFAFAISSLAIAMHSLLVGQKVFTRLLPSINWYFAMRLEYISLVIMIAAFIVYIAGMFPKLLHKKGLQCYLAFSTLYLIIILCTQPSFYSWGLYIYQVISVPYGIYVIIRFFQHILHHKDLESILITLGAVTFLSAVIIESYFHIIARQSLVYGLDQPGMLIFILSNMVALSIRYANTETKLMEMTELNRMKTEFLNQATHDLKTPIAAMDLSLQRLKEVRDEKEKAKFLSALHRSQKDMARLTGNLLSVARLDVKNTQHQLTSYSIIDLCADIQEKYEETLELSNITLDISTDTSASILCDKIHIWSIFDNLIYNAIRYTPQGGSIHIHAYQEHEHILILLSDTGPGIEVEHLPHIFERGYIADKKGGTGIGLYIVKNTMEAMQGSVRAEYVKDSGATFILTFLQAKE